MVTRPTIKDLEKDGEFYILNKKVSQCPDCLRALEWVQSNKVECRCGLKFEYKTSKRKSKLK